MQTKRLSSESEWTVLKLIQWSTTYFTSHHIESPRAAAEILLAHVLGLERVDLYVQFDRPLIPGELSAFKELLKRRINREPIAHILGKKEFWSLELDCTAKVLIPRPDTECLVEWALERLSASSDARRYRVLDLGTGTGAIVLALAKSRPGHMYVASDISIAALELAGRNAGRHQLDGAVRLVCSDWMAAFKAAQAGFDLIVCNPPYIPTAVIDTLEPEIAGFEPRRALDGGRNGLACIGHIIHGVCPHLADAGELMLEIGFDQKKAVDELIASSGLYSEWAFRKDYGGNDRVVWMKKR